MHHPTDRIAHTTAFVKPVVEHWLRIHDVSCVIILRNSNSMYKDLTIQPRWSNMTSTLLLFFCFGYNGDVNRSITLLGIQSTLSATVTK